MILLLDTGKYSDRSTVSKRAGKEDTVPEEEGRIQQASEEVNI